jgi:hypothetical protein
MRFLRYSIFCVSDLGRPTLGEIAEEGERARRGFHHRDTEDTKIRGREILVFRCEDFGASECFFGRGAFLGAT